MSDVSITEEAPVTKRDFRDDLRPLEAVTEEQLAEAMQRIPDHIVMRLRQGPNPSRYTCGVCEAFGKQWYKNTQANMDDPMWLVWAYHEFPKVHMQVRDDQFHGAAANMVYERCIATYRAAGWQGEAQPANA